MDGHRTPAMAPALDPRPLGLHAAFCDVFDAMEAARDAAGLSTQKATLVLSLRDDRAAVALLSHGVSSAPIDPLRHGSAHARLPWHRHKPLLQAVGKRLMDALAAHPVWSFLADGCVLHLHPTPIPTTYPTPSTESAMLLAHHDLVIGQGRWRDTSIAKTAFLDLWRDLDRDRPDGVERMLRHRDLGGRPIAKGPFSLDAARRLRSVLEGRHLPSGYVAPYAILEKNLDTLHGIHPRGVHGCTNALPTRVPRAVGAAYKHLMALQRTLPAALLEAQFEGGVGAEPPTGSYTVLGLHEARLHLVKNGRPAGMDADAQACHAALTTVRDAFHRFVQACAQASPCLARIWAQRPPSLSFRPEGAIPDAQIGATPTRGLLPILCGLPIAHKTALAPFFVEPAKQRPYHVFVSADTARVVPASSARRALAIVAAYAQHTPASIWTAVENDLA